MSSDSPLRLTDEGVVLEVWVVPGARRTEIRGIHDGALRVRVAAPAGGGQANRALLAYLQSLLGSRVRLQRGGGRRRKQLLVESTDLRAIAALVGIANR